MAKRVPAWIGLDWALSIHHRQISEHGGEEGIRDKALLESALARPRHLFLYSESRPDIAALAASYLTAISQNHPFFDGNKRTAAVICEVFIILNGFDLNVSSKDWYALNMRVASGSLDSGDLGSELRSRLKKR